MKNKSFLSILAASLAALCLVSCSAGDGDSHAPFQPAGDNMMGADAIMNEYYSPAQAPGAADGRFDGDFGDIIENTYVSTATQPTSTFSADIDTASYTYFRKLVTNGCDLATIRGAAGGLRTEEMVNYFKYDYAEPAEGELFSVMAELLPCPWSPSENTRLLRLGLRARSTTEAAGNNLVFLIDVSGSMRSDDKLPLLQSTFRYLTDQLGADDTVSIVTYSGGERVVLDGCPGNQRERIQAAIDSLVASGSTNGEAGLRRAYETAQKHFIKGGNNRIIMASDGDLNVGISDPAALKAFVSDMKASGVYMSILGYGSGNYRDSNMEALADNGNGVYYYIDSDTEAERVFCTELTSTLYTVAEDVKLRLSFASDYISEYRLVGYENRVMNNEDFNDDTRDAGEVGAGCSVTVCYEVKLTDSALSALTDPNAMQPRDLHWLVLSVRYKQPGEQQSQLREYVFDSEIACDADDEAIFICAVIETSLLIHNSKYITADSGIGSISDIVAQLRDCRLADEYQQQFYELLKKLA